MMYRISNPDNRNEFLYKPNNTLYEYNDIESCMEGIRYLIGVPQYDINNYIWEIQK